MLNTHEDVAVIVNRLITSTDLSAKDIGTILNDAVFNAVNTARKYEQCPFICPEGMSNKKFIDVGILFMEARDLYETKHGDIYAFMSLVEAANFKPTDTKAISIEKLRKFFDEIQESTTSWIDHIPMLMNRNKRWSVRLENILNADEGQSENVSGR